MCAGNDWSISHLCWATACCRQPQLQPRILKTDVTAKLKELLRFSTTQNCLPRLNDRPLFTDLRRAGNAFGLILIQNHDGNIAGVRNTLNFEKARAFFANELGFQVLKTCPNILTPNEKSRIETLKLELKRQ